MFDLLMAKELEPDETKETIDRDVSCIQPKIQPETSTEPDAVTKAMRKREASNEGSDEISATLKFEALETDPVSFCSECR